MNKSSICIVLVCLPSVFSTELQLPCQKDHVCFIYQQIIRLVASIAPAWHKACAYYTLLNTEWTTAQDCSCRCGPWGLSLGEWSEAEAGSLTASGSERGLGTQGPGERASSQPRLSRLHVQAAYLLCLWESEICLGWIHSYHSVTR